MLILLIFVGKLLAYTHLLTLHCLPKIQQIQIIGYLYSTYNSNNDDGGGDGSGDGDGSIQKHIVCILFIVSLEYAKPVSPVNIQYKMFILIILI